MTKKAVTKRIRITKGGKILRRAMALGHSRANKSRVQTMRKEGFRTLEIKPKIIRKYLRA